MNTEDLIEALDNAGYDHRAYSGRAMYGKQCVGVNLENDIDLWRLARDLIDLEIGPPKTDSMGLGIIAYWPRYEITDVEAESAS